MIINTIYASYQGEINAFGIGHPVIFIRTGGCPLRCYKETLGMLCDTPEALERDSGENMTICEIIDKVDTVSKNYGGIRLICLTGGDPLWRNKFELHDLFTVLEDKKYFVSVETSGTINPLPFIDYERVSWVLDYKLKSAGVKPKFVDEILPLLKAEDIIKFVINDHEDYDQFIEVVEPILNTTVAKVGVGLLWGTNKLTYNELVNLLMSDKLLGRVLINIQAHKMITLYDEMGDRVHSLKIPTEI